jgi:sugar transferase (PEP-CTERM/EpsH1 system associated)
MHILWLKTELLHPVDKGGKIRSYNMLRELKRNHRITYLTLDDGACPKAVSAAEEYCHDLIRVPHIARGKFTAGFYSDLLFNLGSSLPYAISKYKSAEMRSQLVRRLIQGDIDVLVCDFLTPAINVDFAVDCPTVLFQHNVEAMIWKRHYEVQLNPLKKAYLYGQWMKMRSFEKRLCRKFDTVIAVSAEDREQMRTEYDVDAIFDIPTGVDTDFFRPSGTETCAPKNLVFTGSMDWLPNEDAIRYFVHEVLPIVRQRVPDVTLTVVGRNPSPSLIDLAEKDASIVVTGRVDDVRPYIEQAAVYVVPLRIGGGTRLKIYEAMAMEKPIVSTTIGAEGLPLNNGSELLLADTAESFANSVVQLLDEPELAQGIGACAAATVRQRFGWGQVASRFSDVCQQTVTRKVSTANVVKVTSADRPIVYGER